MNEQDIYIYYYNKLRKDSLSLSLSYWIFFLINGNNLEKIYYLFIMLLFFEWYLDIF